VGDTLRLAVSADQDNRMITLDQTLATAATTLGIPATQSAA